MQEYQKRNHKSIGHALAFSPMAPYIIYARSPVTPSLPVEPCGVQKNWMALRSGMFIHPTSNTYYDTEWSNETLDPIKFNPTKIYIDQWCRVDGSRQIHCNIKEAADGFAIGRLGITSYSVDADCLKKNTYRGCKLSKQTWSDIGFYCSLWDRQEKKSEYR